MIEAIWRIAGRDFDGVAFCQRFGLRPAVIRSHANGVSANIPIPGTRGARSPDAAIRRFLKRHRQALSWLKRRHVASSLDVGFTVGSDKHFTRTVRFAPDVLTACARANLTLEVSAYPSNGVARGTKTGGRG
jgi:hypothetical protein